MSNFFKSLATALILFAGISLEAQTIFPQPGQNIYLDGSHILVGSVPATVLGTNAPGTAGYVLTTDGVNFMYWSSITAAGGAGLSANNIFSGMNTFGIVSVTVLTNAAGTANAIAIYDGHTPPKLISLANGGANTFLQGTTPPTYTSIPDAALSGNVPLINAQNNFTGSNFINSTIGFVQAMLSTNAWANGPTGGIDFAAGGYQEYKITSGNCAITGIANKPSALMPFVELMLTNSTGSDSTVFYTGAITTDDGARSWVVTNKTARSVWVRYSPSGLTNASSRPWF